MSYLRAKKTFFTPAADYELNVPSDILAPFHTPHFACPHPDPIVFAEVAWEVHGMLKESLDRFVIAAYNNVGTRRAICGIAGGITFALLGSVAPACGQHRQWTLEVVEVARYPRIVARLDNIARESSWCQSRRYYPRRSRRSLPFLGLHDDLCLWRPPSAPKLRARTTTDLSSETSGL